MTTPIPAASHPVPVAAPVGNHAEMLILSDGRILAHNITPAIAAVLSRLVPHDAAMRLRARPASPSAATCSLSQSYIQTSPST